MMRLALFCLLFVGCSIPVASPDFQPLAAAVLAVQNDFPAPGPSPSGRCENCNGTGKVGDGTVFVKCAVCDGKGTLSEPAEAQPTPDCACADCKCDPCECKTKELSNDEVLQIYIENKAAIDVIWGNEETTPTLREAVIIWLANKPAPPSLAPAPPVVTLPAPAALPQKRYILGNGRVVLGPAYDDPGYREWYDAVVVPAQQQASQCGPGGCGVSVPRGFFGRWR